MSEKRVTQPVAWLALMVSALSVVLAIWTWYRSEIRWDQDGGKIVVMNIGVGTWATSQDGGGMTFTYVDSQHVISRDSISGTSTTYFGVSLESRGRESAVFRGAGFVVGDIRIPSGSVFCADSDTAEGESTVACDFPLRIESGDDLWVMIGMDSVSYDRLMCAGEGGKPLRLYVESLTDYPSWETEIRTSAVDECAATAPVPTPTP